MSLVRIPKARDIALTLPLAYTASWLLYYAITDTRRRLTILKREAKLRKTLEKLGVDLTSDEEVTDEEKDAWRERFGSLKFAGRYFNPFVEWREQGAWETPLHQLINILSFKFLKAPGLVPKDRPIPDLPVETPDYKILFGDSSNGEGVDSKVEIGEKTTFTWIGQSTTYVQLSKLCILTDPIFAPQTIPSRIAPWRIVPVPCQLKDIEKVDVVLVSHNHYDHLDPQAIKEIGDKAQWFVGKGVGSFIIQNGVSPSRVTEMDWWQEESLTLEIEGEKSREFVVTATPNMHWTARHPLNTNATISACFHVQALLPSDSPTATSTPSPKPHKSLLSTSTLKSKNLTRGPSFFHVGDTGYSPSLYSAIGRVLSGPNPSEGISVAAIPIGSYEPRWHMSIQHTDPEGAVGIAMDTNVKHGFGVHWGTWIMSGEPYNKPPKDLAIAREKLGVSEERLTTVPFGRTVVL